MVIYIIEIQPMLLHQRFYYLLSFWTWLFLINLANSAVDPTNNSLVTLLDLF